MSEAPVQNFANHRRFDPSYHFFVFGVFVVNLLLQLWTLIKNPGLLSAWSVVVGVAMIVLVLKARTYPLKAQDRVIRLEERMRLLSLASEPLRGRIGELTTPQLVALRFASDSEVPALAQAALEGRLSPDEIKKKIVIWRADNERV